MTALMESTWLGLPIAGWLGGALLVLGLMAHDLGLLQREPHDIPPGRSAAWSAFYLGLGLLPAAALHLTSPDVVVPASPGEAASDYLAGFATGKLLVAANVFVIAAICTGLGIARRHRWRLLFWALLGLLLLQGLVRGVAADALRAAPWVLSVFGVGLVIAGVALVRLVRRPVPDAPLPLQPLLERLRRHGWVTGDTSGDRFRVRRLDARTRRPVSQWTPLGVGLVLALGAALVFAVAAVPALQAVAPDSPVLLAAHLTALLGLRALYFAVEAAVRRFDGLPIAVGLLMAGLGTKLVLGPWLMAGGALPVALTVAAVVAGSVSTVVLRARRRPMPPPARR